MSDTICIENGLSIVENPKPHGKSYDQWLGDQSKPSHRELLRAAIDNALAQKPADLEELLKLLRDSGCEVSKREQSYRLKLPGWSKVSRLDSLGDGYSLEDLLALLAGQKEHTPRQKSGKQADPPKVNLLVDIQAKLQAGKGAGYVRWAKVFNLKQMAQTVNFLTEHNLLEYAVLEEKAAAATARHNELSAKIKAAEKRMAEIAVLRAHIINYAKTRETYVAYRKAGYSNKFRQEYEEEILLHQAAKNAFDDMGVKKLPQVKELQAEYARLLEKKKIYAEYRRSREGMRELLTAKANVDRLLKLDEEQKKEQEKEHDRLTAGHAPKRSQNAQPQNGILRSWRLGGCPQQAAPEAEWLSRSIACQYYRKVLITRLSNNRITERSLVYQSRDYPKFCLKLPYSVD